MIDIHSHILPGIDDGSPNMEESLAMAKGAIREGISTIVATPHHMNGRYESPKSLILRNVEEFNDVLQKESLHLTVLPGQEIRIHGEILEGLESGSILSMNILSPYLLIELPYSHVPRYTEKLLFELQLKGCIPVIAHPERNAEMIENPDILYKLVSKGALSQITASSITGDFGKKAREFSLKAADFNLIHFIASDAHNASSRRSKIAQALYKLEKKVGAEKVRCLIENAELMVQGKAVYKETPEKFKRKRIMGIF